MKLLRLARSEVDDDRLQILTQFVSLEEAGVAISMDGRGRALDNVFVERLWRTVKYEDIYPKAYATVPALETGLSGYFDFYCHRRIHQSLGYRTPAEVYLVG